MFYVQIFEYFISHPITSIFNYILLQYLTQQLANNTP
nr:MAG TPA: hypothetical protein [Caudoviricetes sp.]